MAVIDLGLMVALVVSLQGDLELGDDGLEALYAGRVDENIVHPNEGGMGTSWAERWGSGGSTRRRPL